jgi:hypothetical protein
MSLILNLSLYNKLVYYKLCNKLKYYKLLADK